MSRCDAVVVEVDGSDVWVEVDGRAPACGSCGSADTCQDGLAGLKTGARRYRLANRIGARVGDRVSLTVADGTLLRVSLASYGLPAVLAIAGAVLGNAAGGDASAIGGLLVGLGCGFGLLRRRELRARRFASPLSLDVSTREVRFKEIP